MAVPVRKKPVRKKTEVFSFRSFNIFLEARQIKGFAPGFSGALRSKYTKFVEIVPAPGYI